jgi:hypothetical protein
MIDVLQLDAWRMQQCRRSRSKAVQVSNVIFCCAFFVCNFGADSGGSAAGTNARAYLHDGVTTLCTDDGGGKLFVGWLNTQIHSANRQK